MSLRRFMLLVPLVGCTPDTSDVVIQLAPQVISSIDGQLSVHAIVLAERQPAPGEAVELSVVYADRNGTDHVIPAQSGTTDGNGVFDAAITGLTWDGHGTVTVAVAGGPDATATFAVLDRTPPKVTILPPATNQVRAGQDITIDVHVTDEIGVSQVFFEGRDRSDLITTGAADITATFDFRVPDAVGTMVMLYALAEDMSGNQGAAQPITVTVVP